VRAIEATKKDGFRLNLQQILMADTYVNDSEDDSDGDDYDETGEAEATDDYNSEQAEMADRRRRCGRPPRSFPPSTNTGPVGEDLLQMQPSATIDAIHDCRPGKPAAPSRMTPVGLDSSGSPA